MARKIHVLDLLLLATTTVPEVTQERNRRIIPRRRLPDLQAAHLHTHTRSKVIHPWNRRPWRRHDDGAGRETNILPQETCTLRNNWKPAENLRNLPTPHVPEKRALSFPSQIRLSRSPVMSGANGSVDWAAGLARSEHKQPLGIGAMVRACVLCFHQKRKKIVCSGIFNLTITLVSMCMPYVHRIRLNCVIHRQTNVRGTEYSTCFQFYAWWFFTSRSGVEE
jgi:hypothetical protein